MRPLTGGRIKQNIWGNLIMKTQMRFQKILMIITIVVAALSIVFALMFCSGTFFQMQTTLYLPQSDKEYVAGFRDLFNATQGVSNTVLTIGIVTVVAAALNFISASHSRRKYYVTNYVTIGATVVMLLVVAIIIIAQLSNVLGIIGTIDWAAAEAEHTMYAAASDPWNYSIWTVPVGFALAAIMIVNAVVLGLNVLWKVKLMQGEKKLLEGNFEPVKSESAEEVA